MGPAPSVNLLCGNSASGPSTQSNTLLNCYGPIKVYLVSISKSIQHHDTKRAASEFLELEMENNKKTGISGA